MKKRLKSIPEFASEDEEREFWEQNDSSDYIDWGQAQPVVLPKLKPTTKTISLRPPSIFWIQSRPRPTHAMYPTNH